MTAHYTATNRKTLAALIVSIPMDEDATIMLDDCFPFKVTYKFPAVMRSDGGEIEPRLGRWKWNREAHKDEWVYTNPDPEDHREYQIKRRARIAAKVRQRQWKERF